MNKKKLVVLTGAGISAESGLKTFRDSDGLWEGYDVMEVATPRGWKKNPSLVLEFYNARRKNVSDAQPNAAHTGLAELENDFDVHIKLKECHETKPNTTRCPLCHMNIPEGDKPWREHLMGVDGCVKNPRRIQALKKRE